MRVKEYLRRKVAFFASVIEIAISIIVLIAIVIAGIQVVREVFSLAGDPKAHEGFTVFLGHAFNLIIGVELAKTSVEKIFHPSPVEFSPVVGAVLVLSILVKLWMALSTGTWDAGLILRPCRLRPWTAGTM